LFVLVYDREPSPSEREESKQLRSRWTTRAVLLMSNELMFVD
jgi:hypothetical protein